jgi:hypothetical protein
MQAEIRNEHRTSQKTTNNEPTSKSYDLNQERGNNFIISNILLLAKHQG